MLSSEANKEFERICKKCALDTEGSDSVTELFRYVFALKDEVHLLRKTMGEELKETIRDEISKSFDDMSISIDQSTLTVDVDYDILSEKIVEKLREISSNSGNNNIDTSSEKGTTLINTTNKEGNTKKKKTPLSKNKKKDSLFGKMGAFMTTKEGF